MKGSILDGLDIREAKYKLSNGNELKIVALDIFQSINIQKKMVDLSKGDDSERPALFREVAQLAVVDENYQPYLTEAELNLMSRAGDGQILIEIFNLVMKLSGVGDDEQAEAKKK